MIRILRISTAILTAFLFGVAAAPFKPGEILARAHKIAAGETADPEAAHFRNDRIGPRGNAVCGEINAKNIYGGYNGYIPYVYEDGAARVTFFAASAVSPSPQQVVAACAFQLAYSENCALRTPPDWPKLKKACESLLKTAAKAAAIGIH